MLFVGSTPQYNETLTPIGQMLAKLPVDIVIGKMLIMGTVFHVRSIYSGTTLHWGMKFWPL